MCLSIVSFRFYFQMLQAYRNGSVKKKKNKPMSFHKVHCPNRKVASSPDGESSPACYYPSAAVLCFYQRNLATVHTFLAEKKPQRTISSRRVYQEQEGPHK